MTLEPGGVPPSRAGGLVSRWPDEQQGDECRDGDSPGGSGHREGL